MKNKKNLVSVSLLISAVLASVNIVSASDRWVNTSIIDAMSGQQYNSIDVTGKRYEIPDDPDQWGNYYDEASQSYKPLPEDTLYGDLMPDQAEGFGGGIENSGTIYYLMNNSYTDNKADFGGGLSNLGIIESIQNEVFSNNTAVQDGGAVYNVGTIGSIAGTFTGNNAFGLNNGLFDGDGGNGGAIFNFGGGILPHTSDQQIFMSASIESIDGTFERNNASWHGGAVYNTGQIGDIKGTYKNNTSQTGYGGAIYNNDTVGDKYTPAEDDEALKFGEINSISGTFTGNSAAQGGGAIYNGGKIETVSGKFTNNGKYTYTENEQEKTVSTMYGGAIKNDGTISNLNSADFKGNSSIYKGGAIHNTGDLQTKSTINFDENTSKDGGALYNEGTYNIARYTNFNNNKAEENGGAIYNTQEGTITSSPLSNQTFSGNSAGSKGGAIYNEGNISLGGDPSVYSGENNSVIFTNNSAAQGGAIYNTGTLDLKKAVFNGNTATEAGGAIYNTGNDLTISGLTFQNNSVTNTTPAESQEIANQTGGGAIYNNGKLTVTNSNFTGNKANTAYTSTQQTQEEIEGHQVVTNSTGNGTGGFGGAISNTGELTLQNSNFNGNQATYGGAVSNKGTTNITGSTFTNNTAYNAHTINSVTTINDNDHNANQSFYDGAGGAILADGDAIIENSNFTGNKAAQSGGAVAANGNLTIRNSTFRNNTAKSETNSESLQINFETGEVITNNENTVNGYGGAIANSQSATKLTVENSTFEGNSSGSQGGGAIAALTAADISGSNFNSNTTTGSGGAVEVVYGNATIKNSNFNKNSAVTYGGAIANAQDTTANITSNSFDSNSAEFAGALYNEGTAEISDSTFTNNTAAQSGGAILSSTGKLTVKNSEFRNNSTTSVQTDLDDFEPLADTLIGGGAILSSGETIIDNSRFDGNSTVKSGGAILTTTADITNSSFTNNSAGANGGAISAGASTDIGSVTEGFFEGMFNAGKINITDTDFTNNSAQKLGGAIYYSGSNNEEDKTTALNINAVNKDVTFSGNTAQKGGDIYLHQATANLNASNGHSIAFNSGIAGNGTINANGNILLNSAVTPDNGALAVNLNSGVIKSSVDNYLNGTDLTIAEGATLDLINNQTGTLDLNSLTANNGNLKIDLDFANLTNPADIINANSASGTLNLIDINILSEMADGTNTITAPFKLDNMTILTPQNGFNILTNDYLYTVTAQDATITIDRLHEGDTATKIDGFTLAVNQNDKAGGVDLNLTDERSFSANKDIEITGSGLEKGWTGDLGGTKLTVNGNGYNINGSDKVGITVSDGQTLEFNDANITGFQTTEDKKGALVVKDNGTLNINASNYDVNISGVTSGGENLDSNAIYLDGTGAAKANFNALNGKNITVDNDIRSAAVGNEVKMAGNGTIKFNGEINPVTLTNENANTVHNNYVSGANYNLNSGTVSFTRDAYLNGNGTANNLIFNGGTLNIANGETNAININELSLNANSNIMVDADLAAGKMDTLSAATVNSIQDGVNLNVSGINLLSDAKDKNTVINFVNDETLMSHITSSVSSVAYSPIYKYGVGYDAATGDFSFTRGSASDYNNVNPAIMVAPVAAQLGGYFTQLNAYDQAFANMDMTMLMTAEQRQALKNYNKYAYDGNGPVGPIPSTSGAIQEERAGIWARPYSSFENVHLKNGPRVSNVMYGSFFGGDTSIKELGHGFDGVFSLYAGYNGSHQSFNGNSLWQNGGTVGLTGTLYKGNWFGGWTVAGGLSGVDASTMYGSEDFMLWSLGTAIKTGYNWELLDGKFIIQPHYLMSYTFVDTENYTNAAGYRISSDPLNAIQISPGLRFIGNLKNGWQPYLGVDFMWNIMDKTKFDAAETSLPQLSTKPYIQYGIGVQKRWGERSTGYLQAMFRNIGRNGVIFSFGYRAALGK